MGWGADSTVSKCRDIAGQAAGEAGLGPTGLPPQGLRAGPRRCSPPALLPIGPAGPRSAAAQGGALGAEPSHLQHAPRPPRPHRPPPPTAAVPAPLSSDPPPDLALGPTPAGPPALPSPEGASKRRPGAERRRVCGPGRPPSFSGQGWARDPGSAIPAPCKQVPRGGASRPRGSGRPRGSYPEGPQVGGGGVRSLSGARGHRTGPVTGRPRTAPPRPKSPRLGSPARPPPGQGGGAYPAFGRPRLQFAAPASGSGCGSRAPWPSAGRRGPRGRPAAERPAGRGILAAAARGWRVPLNSTPPPLPPSLPPLAPPPPPRPCSDPAARLAAPRRPGAGGGAGRMPPRAPPRRPSDRPAPASRRRGPLSLSVGPRVCGSSVSHRRGRALRMRASRPKPPREGGVSGEAWAILASCCRLGSVHTLDAGHGLPAAWGLGAGMDSGNLGPGVEGSGTASQRKPDLR
ncbi:basic proline-rich protein-like [Cervus canadensis]|uniref:basic proline-rich protein-like n=1 Tax=Cervus canadensis TaxID=1574408 RepID=UPI001C9E49DC|nr:basic proline-rich protein-like [Cervus canadensis]